MLTIKSRFMGGPCVVAFIEMLHLDEPGELDLTMLPSGQGSPGWDGLWEGWVA